MFVRVKSIALVLMLVGIMMPSLVRAQDYERQYKTAKGFFKEGRFNLAMEAFKPVVIYDKSNPYSQYASFYYAVSAYKQNFPAVAKDMFLQIKGLYPKWEKLNEVNYWLAKIYFDQRQYFQALHVLKELPSGSVAEDEALMKGHYLNQIEDVETLRMMLEEYPNDKVIAKSLAKAISKKPFLEQDTNLMDSIITKYQLNRAEFATALMPDNVFKDRYTVSLLFPFLSKTLEPTTAPKVNQSVLDLYQGMRMAVDTLEKQGIHIDLRSYDTERSTSATTTILTLEELKSSDLLVGPLFNGQLKLVQEFSVNNKINMISPVSSNTEFIGESPFAILYPPSYETIGVRSAEWLAGRIRNRNCMVFYGDNAKDSTIAGNFISRSKELDLNIVWAEKVTKETSADIFTKLATPTEFDDLKNPIEFKMKLDSIGSIFVASDDALIYTKVISGVDTRGDSIIVVGNETWLNNAAANFETYERLHLTMAAPNFAPFKNPNFKAFRQAYLSKHGVLPSEYAKIGYEFMWFVGKSLHKHGVYFQEGLSEVGFIPGYMFRGYNFENARSNSYVPFIHFVNGELTYAND